jgi:hypothetical protein
MRLAALSLRRILRRIRHERTWGYADDGGRIARGD